MQFGNYPPSGADTDYWCTDSACPTRWWKKVGGVWRPWIGGCYLGWAPGSNADFPSDYGAGVVRSSAFNCPWFNAPSLQGIYRPWSTAVGAFAEACYVESHDAMIHPSIGSSNNYSNCILLYHAGSGRARAFKFREDMIDSVSLNPSAGYRTMYSFIRQTCRRGANVWRVTRTSDAVIQLSLSPNGLDWWPAITMPDEPAAPFDSIGMLVEDYLVTRQIGIQSWIQG